MVVTQTLLTQIISFFASGGKTTLISPASSAFSIRWSARNLSIHLVSQFLVRLFSQIIFPAIFPIGVLTIWTKSAPRLPFFTSEISSLGNAFRSEFSKSNSKTSPCVCWLPCSALRRASSRDFFISAICLSFSNILSRFSSACFSPASSLAFSLSAKIIFCVSISRVSSRSCIWRRVLLSSKSCSPSFLFCVRSSLVSFSLSRILSSVSCKNFCRIFSLISFSIALRSLSRI